jgi:hypothetical protein
MVPPPCKRSARKRRAYGSTKTTLLNSFFMKASLYLHIFTIPFTLVAL